MSVLNSRIALPQNLGPTASPTFAGLTITGFTTGTVVSNSQGVLSVSVAPVEADISLSGTSSQITTSSLSATPTVISVPTWGQSSTLSATDPGQALSTIAISAGTSSINPVFSSLTSTGTLSSGTNSATVGALSCSSLTSTGTLSSGTNSATVGALSCSSLTSTGTLSSGTNSATVGALSCSSVVSSGTASATSISFAATQSALSAYVVGSWTPVLQFGGATTGITYSRQTGSYTRIGNMVSITCDVLLSSKGSATGAAQYTGLPYTPLGGLTGPFDMLACLWSGVSIDATYTSIAGLLNGSNGKIIAPFEMTTVAASSPTQLTNSNFTNTTELIFNGQYFTNDPP